MSKWWDDQTGILGFFTKYLTGVTKTIRTVYGIFSTITSGPFDNIYANMALKLGLLAAAFLGGPITFVLALGTLGVVSTAWNDVLPELEVSEPPPAYKSIADKVSGGNTQSFGYNP